MKKFQDLSIYEIRQNLPVNHILVDAYDYLGTPRVELGITDFSQAGKPVKTTIFIKGFEFERVSTGNIPSRLSGKICTCQIYQLSKL